MPSRRETIQNRKVKPRKLDKTPLEIPASRKTIPDTRTMVRQYVQQAIAQAGGDERTAEEFLKEELDLDPEDPDPPWTSQYEVTEMDEIEPPQEMALQEEGEDQETSSEETEETEEKT